MFTGLIEATGTVRALVPVAGGQRLTIETPLSAELAPRRQRRDQRRVPHRRGPAMPPPGAPTSRPETLRVTALGALGRGRVVNLERPLAIGSRLGGHFVQGHVDGTGRIEAISRKGEFYRVRISFPPALAAYFIEKGSVAVDGISLTVASLGECDLRRPDHSAHLDGHDAAARAARGHREPRMRHGGQVRLARPVAGSRSLMTPHPHRQGLRRDQTLGRLPPSKTPSQAFKRRQDAHRRRRRGSRERGRPHDGGRTGDARERSTSWPRTGAG